MEEQKKRTWDEVVEHMSKEPDIVKCQTKDEVFQEIEEFLVYNYGCATTGERIKEMTECLTEDIWKKLSKENEKETIE